MSGHKIHIPGFDLDKKTGKPKRKVTFRSTIAQKKTARKAAKIVKGKRLV